jgi:multiple sugar transport system ATP-binding protein
MASITLDRVSKSFGAFTAVRGIDLAIDDGEFVAILGPSGCGKTTTMNMIAGLESVSSGRILFDSREVTAVPVAKRGVGFVFQNYAVFTHMSVRQNLAFGLEVRGRPKSEIDRKVGEMAEFMALAHRLDEPSSRLSVNELQKLAIGRSAIVEPAIFLLDEPLSNLDAAFREKMREDLRGLQRALKQTMVYVTHDQIEAMGLADRIAVMDRAVLQQFAAPAVIHDWPANVFVARFIGTPGMNVLSARLAAPDALSLGTDGPTIPIDPSLSRSAAALARPDVLFGFRPGDVRLVAGGTPGGFPARIALVETVGRRRIVHFTAGGASFLGTFPRETGLPADGLATLRIEPGRAHLFDPATEARLPREGERHG